MPLLSIVTIHLDDFEGLSNTLQSIEKVNDKQLNWVLIDGGSQCSNREEEQLLEKALAFSTFSVSEPDDGIYDAMNKGTRLANGEYVLYLNAGDLLHSKFSLSRIFAQMPTSKPGMVWGHCIERHLTGEEIEIRPRSPRSCWYGIPAYHPAILFRRDLLGSEPYNLKYKIAADYDLISRLITEGVSIQCSSMRIAIFYRGGLSDLSHSALREEEHLIRMDRFNMSLPLSMTVKYTKSGMKKLSGALMFRRLMRKVW